MLREMKAMMKVELLKAKVVGGSRRGCKIACKMIPNIGEIKSHRCVIEPAST
jgi:hypothetical protein